MSTEMGTPLVLSVTNVKQLADKQGLLAKHSCLVTNTSRCVYLTAAHFFIKSAYGVGSSIFLLQSHGSVAKGRGILTCVFREAPGAVWVDCRSPRCSTGPQVELCSAQSLLGLCREIALRVQGAPHSAAGSRDWGEGESGGSEARLAWVQVLALRGVSESSGLFPRDAPRVTVATVHHVPSMAHSAPQPRVLSPLPPPTELHTRNPGPVRQCHHPAWLRAPPPVPLRVGSVPRSPLAPSCTASPLLQTGQPLGPPRQTFCWPPLRAGSIEGSRTPRTFHPVGKIAHASGHRVPKSSYCVT